MRFARSPRKPVFPGRDGKSIHPPQRGRSDRCALLLLSGGLDSAACVDFYLQQGASVSGLHVSFGQPAADRERLAAARIASYYHISLKRIIITGACPKPPGQILGRNAMLIFLALGEIDEHTSTIALGIHRQSPYYDCSPIFLTTSQAIVDGQCDGRISIAAPFMEWSKIQIWRYSIERQVPVDLTYSCEKGTEPPCGVCLSCRDMEVLRAGAMFNHSA